MYLIKTQSGSEILESNRDLGNGFFSVEDKWGEIPYLAEDWCKVGEKCLLLKDKDKVCQIDLSGPKERAQSLSLYLLGNLFIDYENDASIEGSIIFSAQSHLDIQFLEEEYSIEISNFFEYFPFKEIKGGIKVTHDLFGVWAMPCDL